MDPEESELKEKIAAAELVHATAEKRLLGLRAALDALRAVLYPGVVQDGFIQTPAEMSADSTDETIEGINIILMYFPDSGMTHEELSALLERHGVSKGKKKNMIGVSIQTNLRWKNLEMRDGRYYLTARGVARRKPGWPLPEPITPENLVAK